MMPPRPTELAWMLLRDAIHAGDLCIDATAGNGHDTAFLAGCVGESGRVIAFDVQEAAIHSARSRVAAAGLDSRVDFHHASHVGMAAHAAAESVSVVMFNLGYLPGEDHGLTTRGGETLTALDAAALLLKPGGVLSVICYPGHAEGVDEAARVEQWMCALASHGWRIAKYGMPATMRPAPFLLLAAKSQRQPSQRGD